MKGRKRVFGLVVSVAVVSVILASGTQHAHAGVVSWNQPSGGDYETTVFWMPPSSPGGPKVSDDVTFALPAAYTITFNSSPTNRTLSVLDGEVRFIGAGGLHTYAISDGVEVETGQLYLGNKDNAMYVDAGVSDIILDSGGQLGIDHGLLSNHIGYIGYISGTTSTVTVGSIQTSSAEWTNSSNLYVGYDGTGVLMVQEGGHVSNSDGFIARKGGSTGTVTVEDENSSWMNSGALYIGGSSNMPGGTGNLNVGSGGTVNVTGATKLWNC